MSLLDLESYSQQEPKRNSSIAFIIFIGVSAACEKLVFGPLKLSEEKVGTDHLRRDNLIELIINQGLNITQGLTVKLAHIPHNVTVFKN